jgi:hypothetical protein
MSKKKTFIDSPDWAEIVENINGIMTSDSTIETILDFERVLDEADIYAYENWEYGELVDGPTINRYDVAATFMWPQKLMPDPRAGKRLISLGCGIKFKKTKIKVPITVKSPDDFEGGTHYPKLVDQRVWLINIVIPKDLLNDIREGSIDIAEQSIELEDLDSAYEEDYDKTEVDDEEDQGGGMPGMGAPMPGGDLGAMPPPPPM